MNQTIERLLRGEQDNHILPFFWQHGEDEATLRGYMRVIQEANCGAVCVESRPHPDFCREKWWRDMDIILDEAAKRGMKVWILDDSHFPTGFANGAVEKAPQELCRQSICANQIKIEAVEAKMVTIELTGTIPPPFTPSFIEQHVLPRMPKPRVYNDDCMLCVMAYCRDSGAALNLSAYMQNHTLIWEKPAGNWTIWVTGLSRNCGPHRNYINMLKWDSCKILIDAVYEPHYARYKAHFGNTIAGFFSDEPELGNGHLYDQNARLGTDQDLPFSDELPAYLEERLGVNWAEYMFLLWEKGADSHLTAKVRYAFMDAVTSLVRKNFSYQIGDWCRARGVAYIGHILEDAGSHARTASSLGHFFRGLAGQDMAGIDDIGGQVYPQGENDNRPDYMGRPRDSEFYHFLLGRLASSAAAIEPLKKGRAMCEIFGNYGWAEGVRLEKYLADHFIVRGVNYYVPHAFSPKAFPDPDCPPHFYAHGHNPQYRHFGELMRYMNNICTLISSGSRVTQAAVMYHAEAEWSGECMLSEKVARVLEEQQIGFDILPFDVFSKPDEYHTKIGETLQVNTQSYKILVVPYMQYIPADFALAVTEMQAAGMQIVFIDKLPEGVCSGNSSALKLLGNCTTVPLSKLVDYLSANRISEIQASPANAYLRALHCKGESDIVYLVNEGDNVYSGEITVPLSGPCFAYNAWHNQAELIDAETFGNTTRLNVQIEPLKSLVIVFSETEAALTAPLKESGEGIPVTEWLRSTCEGAAYANFTDTKAITLPDSLAEEQPTFSGFVRYETKLNIEERKSVLLVIADAAEGVEVFVNGTSAGIQIAPPFRYAITDFVHPGENTLAIEVATTLERQCYPLITDPIKKMTTPAPTSQSGITSDVKIYFA